jgi:hypothetical protein
VLVLYRIHETRTRLGLMREWGDATRPGLRRILDAMTSRPAPLDPPTGKPAKD